MATTITRSPKLDTFVPFYRGEYAVTVTNEHGAVVMIRPGNAARSCWGFYAMDASGHNILLTTGTVRPNRTVAEAASEAVYLAEFIGNPGTLQERRAADRMHRYRY